ncbi:MAG: SDR family oxidoreductase [Pseudomonadales bacterium]
MSRYLLITGASKGIGFATAQCFVEQGYKVVNISRSPCEIADVTNLQIDLTTPGWEEANGAAILAALGNPEQLCVVHNAALLEKDTIKDLNASRLRNVLELNVVAAVLLNQIVLAKMSPDSSIIYVGSTLGTKAVANTCSYATSKHALIGLMRATCQDLAGSMIHTACVCPGFTKTEMLQEHLGNDEQIYAAIAAGMTHKRLIEPVEIADAIYFCAQTPVINGTVLDANLGQIQN